MRRGKNRLSRLDEPVLIAVSKSLLTEFGIHDILESCDGVLSGRGYLRRTDH